MSSRLEKLCGDLSYEQSLHEPFVSISTDDLRDLLEVVEAAREIVDDAINSGYVVDDPAKVGCEEDCLVKEALIDSAEEAIAKLDEVQP